MAQRKMGSGKWVAHGRQRGHASFSDTLRPSFTPYVADGAPRTDEQIRADVYELISSVSGDASNLTVSVGNGVVTLRGRVQSETELRRLTEVVRAIPWVKGLDERLRVVPPSLSH